jgi:hypothetical protein
LIKPLPFGIDEMKFPSLISEVDLIFVGAAANLDNAHHLDHDDTEENICRRIISLLHQQASTDSLYRLNACFIQDIVELIVDNRVTGLVSLGTAVDESNCSVCYAKSTSTRFILFFIIIAPSPFI